MRRSLSISMLLGVAALLLLGISFPFHAQQPPEGSVTKVVQGNPTLGIVKFSGELQGRKVLETMLMRCDWFQVLPEGKADRGQVQMQVNAANSAETTHFFVVFVFMFIPHFFLFYSL